MCGGVWKMKIVRRHFFVVVSTERDESVYHKFLISFLRTSNLI